MQIQPKDEIITSDKQLDTQSLAKISQKQISTTNPSLGAMSSVSKSQSRVSYISETTSISTKDKLASVQKELEEERKRRTEAEQIIAFLRSTGQIKLV